MRKLNQIEKKNFFTETLLKDKKYHSADRGFFFCKEISMTDGIPKIG